MRDRLQGLTEAVLRLLAAGNIAVGGILAMALLASFPLEPHVAARLVAKYGAGIDNAAVIDALRMLAVAGIATAFVIRAVLVPLRDIVVTVRRGDAFAAANADRLERIGWGLLGMQLLDLARGGFIAWFARLGVETTVWSPSFIGWLAVLLPFVLARVFREGARMRDDLAMTI